MKGRIDWTKLHVGEDDIGVFDVLGLDIVGQSRRTRPSENAWLTNRSIAWKGGIEPGHLLSMATPQRKRQHHSCPQVLAHSLQPTMLVERVNILANPRLDR